MGWVLNRNSGSFLSVRQFQSEAQQPGISRREGGARARADPRRTPSAARARRMSARTSGVLGRDSRPRLVVCAFRPRSHEGSGGAKTPSASRAAPTAGRTVLSTRPGIGPRPAWALPVPFGRVPRGWPLGAPLPPAGAAGRFVDTDVVMDPLPTHHRTACPGARPAIRPDAGREGRCPHPGDGGGPKGERAMGDGRPPARAPVAGPLEAEGRGVAVQLTGKRRWGDTACPDGVTRASRGLGPVGVVRRQDRLRRVLSRRGPPPGGLAADRSDRHARTRRPPLPFTLERGFVIPANLHRSGVMLWARPMC